MDFTVGAIGVAGLVLGAIALISGSGSAVNPEFAKSVAGVSLAIGGLFTSNIFLTAKINGESKKEEIQTKFEYDNLFQSKSIKNILNNIDELIDLNENLTTGMGI